MTLLNGILSLAVRCRVKWFIKPFISLVTACWFFVTSTVVYAEKVCIDNGGAGYGILDAKDIFGSNTDELGILRQNILFNLGEIDTFFVFDVNVELDISDVQMGDLTARISSPNTTQITLFERPGTVDAEGDPFTSFDSLGCGGRGIDAIFDDESSNPRIENEPCTFSVPVFSGDYKPHDPSPNNLSAFDGENPVGNWEIYISDTLSNGDDEFEGTLNEACVDIQYAGVTFDQWVSTLPDCSDNIDNISVFSGTDVYYCYVVSNPGTEAFTINPGDITNDLLHDLTPLETTYPAETSPAPLVRGPFTAGILNLTVGASPIVNNAGVTATFTTPNFTGTLGPTFETTTVIITAPIEISKTSMVISDPANVTNPKAIPGAIVEYTISVKNIGNADLNNDSIVINDPIPANTSLSIDPPNDPISFIDGIIPSGLSFNFSNDVTVSSTQITINPKGIFNGSNGTDTPSFEIKFKVKVD